jgi:hypothetical protein
MICQRRRAQLGALAATAVFLIAFSIVLAGAFEQPNARIGQPGTEAISFRLPDSNGDFVGLSSWRGRVVVLCFAPNPADQLTRDDIDRLNQLGQRYGAADDVRLVALYSGTDDLSYDGIREINGLAADAGPFCTTLLDPSSRVANWYCIDTMPTFLVIDANGIIRYRGGIDDTSPDAPLASTRFETVIDLLRAERPLPAQPAPAVLSNINK